MSMSKAIPRTVAAGGAVALALTLVAGGRAREASAPGRRLRNDICEAIGARIERQLERLHVPGAALAIVEGDEIAHLRGFGRARPGGAPPTRQTPFAIGTLTKSFTALAVMQLVEAGKVELDAPVRRYLPWFRVADAEASAHLTVRHLLNQTSGLPQLSGLLPLADFDEDRGAGERQARALRSLELTRPVGAAWEYSNMNYNLLGLIVEAASGESYATYVQIHIFAPLAMAHSYTSQAEAKRHGMAVGSRYWFATPIATPNLPSPRGSLPSGQLISSVEDMAHYLIAHLNDGRYGDTRVLSPAGIGELHRPAVAATAMGLSFGHYGMGWFTEETGRARIVSHTGTTPDFSSYMAIIPDQKRGVVLLINANHLIMDRLALTAIGAGAATLLAGETPAPNRPGALVPWALRGLPLIPALQVAGIVATLRRRRRWRQDPRSRPRGATAWGREIVLPLIPDLIATLPLLGLLRTRTLGVMLLYLPDVSWIALVCGGVAPAWAALRTGLLLRARRT